MVFESFRGAQVLVLLFYQVVDDSDRKYGTRITSFSNVVVAMSAASR